MGAANQCTSPCVCSGDCHAAPQFATFNDCNVMTVYCMQVDIFGIILNYFFTVFCGDNIDTYVLYYTASYLIPRFKKVK